jgi:predicted esterase
MPRSPFPCATDAAKRCWPNDSSSAVSSTWDFILADTASCRGQRPLLAAAGFSNGGYFVGKLFQYCFAPAVSGLLAIGSAGSWRITDPRLDLAPCGRLTQLIGTTDMAHDAAAHYVDQLKDRGAAASLWEYPGGHIFPADAVEAWLRLLALTSLPLSLQRNAGPDGGGN